MLFYRTVVWLHMELEQVYVKMYPLDVSTELLHLPSASYRRFHDALGVSIVHK